MDSKIGVKSRFEVEEMHILYNYKYLYEIYVKSFDLKSKQSVSFCGKSLAMKKINIAEGVDGCLFNMLPFVLSWICVFVIRKKRNVGGKILISA